LPARTPAPIVARLNREINEFMATPKVSKLLRRRRFTSPRARRAARDVSAKEIGLWRGIAVEGRHQADDGAAGARRRAWNSLFARFYSLSAMSLSFLGLSAFTVFLNVSGPVHEAVGLLFAALVLASSSGDAESGITDDTGGSLRHYLPVIRDPDSGDTVVIDGVCCPPAPWCSYPAARQVCATDAAKLGFHAAWRPDGPRRRVAGRDQTQRMLASYPANVRAGSRGGGDLGDGVLTAARSMRSSALAATEQARL